MRTVFGPFAIGFKTSDDDGGDPISVSDVNILSQEAGTFVRDQIGYVTQDEIPNLIADL